MITLLNPGTKRRRKYRMTKARRRAIRKLVAASRRRRASAARTYRRKYTKGRLRGFISKTLCGPRWRERVRRLRRSCPKKVRPTQTKGLAESAWKGLFGGSTEDPEAARWLAANPSRFRYKGHNAGSVAKRLTAGFSLSAIGHTVPLVGGVVANNMVRNYLAGMSFMPSFLASGYGNLGLGLVTAGALAAATSKVAPRYTGAVLMGGMADVVMALVTKLTGVKFSGCAGCRGLGCAGCGTMGDVATVASPRYVMNGMRGGSADGGVYMGGPGYQGRPGSTPAGSTADDIDPSAGGDDLF